MTTETISLREHFEAILRERDKRQDERFAAQGSAISKAEESLTRRLDLLNELRGNVATSNDITSVEQRVQDLADRLNRMEGRSGGVNWVIGIGVGLGTLLIAVIGLYFRIH